MVGTRLGLFNTVLIQTIMACREHHYSVSHLLITPIVFEKHYYETCQMRHYHAFGNHGQRGKCQFKIQTTPNCMQDLFTKC